MSFNFVIDGKKITAWPFKFHKFLITDKDNEDNNITYETVRVRRLSSKSLKEEYNTRRKNEKCWEVKMDRFELSWAE